MKNKIIILAVCISAFTTVALFYRQQRVCSGHNLCLGVFGNPPWKLVEIYENTGTSWRGIFSSGDSLVRVQRVLDVSASDAEVLTRARIAQIEGQYKPARSPYPGVISDTVVCAQQYMPSFRDGVLPSKIVYRSFSAYANDRLQYGPCTEQQARYGAEAVLFYCQNTKQLYEVEMFIPLSLYKQKGEGVFSFDRFVCNPQSDSRSSKNPATASYLE